MKQLRFHDLLLVSELERRAKWVPFDPQVTLIKGANDRGKSCLIKSLYSTLGAEVHFHPTWKSLNVTSLLRFNIDDEAFAMLKIGKRYGLFDADSKLVGVYSSITTELGPKIADLFDFHLPLVNTTSKQSQQATPAFLFLPFYVDQDKGWASSWDSFEQLSQFREPRKAAALFHTGIRPKEYYVADATKRAAEEAQEVLRRDRETAKRVLGKIEHLMSQNMFDVDIGSYQGEIERLLTQCNVLKQEEERLRNEMIEYDSHRAAIETQIQITEAAMKELNADFRYATQTLDEHIPCPMCGAKYHNSFAEQFSIAQDEDKLTAFLSELQDEQDKLKKKKAKALKRSDETTAMLQDISTLLEVKQGEIKLRDVLQSEGKKEVRVILLKEVSDLNLQIGQTDSEIQDAKKEMRKWGSPKRAAEIREFYREKMTDHVHALRLTDLGEEAYRDVSAKIEETGSARPRALLAGYFSIFQTIAKYSTSAFCPIVIDSPKQQDLDDDNWMRELQFIRDNRPTNSQLVLGVVNEEGVDLGGSVIELFDDKHLLQVADYDRVMDELRQYIEVVVNTES